MKHFSDIERSYKLIDHYVASQLAVAIKRKSKPEENKWQQIRDINEAAHFVLIFAQLEEGIDKKWKAITPSSKSNMYFMDKVRALTKDPKRRNEIKDYYDMRCDIAHGTMIGVTFVMPQAIAELRAIASKIL